MQTRIYVDGVVAPAEEARIPVLDHGFLFGDSVYEVLWWHRGALIQAEEHLDRLEASARLVYMDLPFGRADLLAAVDRTIEAAGAGPEEEGYVRLVVTRGVGPPRLDPATAPRRSLVVIVAAAERPDAEAFERGIGVALVDRRRNSRLALDPRAKTGNYLNNLLALHEAHLAGAEDALMLNADGEVTEATTSNVYVVLGGRVRTPALESGILEGTTRRRILAICREQGLAADEAAVGGADLLAAEEVFLSSSVRGVLPVVSVDGQPVGDGRVGPLTRRIHRWFEDAADAEARRAREVQRGARAGAGSPSGLPPASPTGDGG